MLDSKTLHAYLESRLNYQLFWHFYVKCSLLWPSHSWSMSHLQTIIDFGYTTWWSVLDAVKHLIQTPGRVIPSGYLKRKEKKRNKLWHLLFTVLRLLLVRNRHYLKVQEKVSVFLFNYWMAVKVILILIFITSCDQSVKHVDLESSVICGCFF